MLSEMPLDSKDGDSICSDEDNDVEMNNDDQLITSSSKTSNSEKKIIPISHQVCLLSHKLIFLFCYPKDEAHIYNVVVVVVYSISPKGFSGLNYKVK